MKAGVVWGLRGVRRWNDGKGANRRLHRHWSIGNSQWVCFGAGVAIIGTSEGAAVSLARSVGTARIWCVFNSLSSQRIIKPHAVILQDSTTILQTVVPIVRSSNNQ